MLGRTYVGIWAKAPQCGLPQFNIGEGNYLTVKRKNLLTIELSNLEYEEGMVFFPIILYRGSPHFVISQFVIPAISWFGFRPHFVNSPPFQDFEEEKRKKKKNQNFFWNFFTFLLIFWMMMSYSDFHLMNIKISMRKSQFVIRYSICM